MKGVVIGKEEVQLYFGARDRILFAATLKILPPYTLLPKKKAGREISDFSKLAGYKGTHNTPLHFYTLAMNIPERKLFKHLLYSPSCPALNS